MKITGARCHYSNRKRSRFARRTVWLSFVLVLVIGPLAVGASIKKGPYLIYNGKPREMILLWELDESADCSVWWGSKDPEAYKETNVQALKDYLYQFTFAGLSQAKKYSYQIMVNGAAAGGGDFVSAPRGDVQSLKFLVYGDTREDDNKRGDFSAQNDVCSAMLDTFPRGYQTFALHVGDWVSQGGERTSWEKELFSQEASHASIRELLSRLPVQACCGNHEWYMNGSNRDRETDEVYKHYWPYPYVDDMYWSFDYGVAHFAVLDQYTEKGLSPRQISWLKEDLLQTQKPWKFILLHDPGWSAGKASDAKRVNNCEVQEIIQPICLEYGVAMVFAGHNHYYARAEVNKVVHVTSGGGGATPATPNPSFPNLKAWSKTGTYQFCTVDITGDVLHFKAIDTKGKTIDTDAILLESITGTRPYDDRSSEADLLFLVLYWIGVIVALFAQFESVGRLALCVMILRGPQGGKGVNTLGWSCWSSALRLILASGIAIGGPEFVDSALPTRVTDFMEFLPVGVASVMFLLGALLVLVNVWRVEYFKD